MVDGRGWHPQSRDESSLDAALQIGTFWHQLAPRFDLTSSELVMAKTAPLVSRAGRFSEYDGKEQLCGGDICGQRLDVQDGR